MSAQHKAALAKGRQDGLIVRRYLEALEASRRGARRRRPVDLPARQRAFEEVAGAYGTRKGISYAAWRAVGVPASVLESAGITRRRS